MRKDRKEAPADVRAVDLDSDSESGESRDLAGRELDRCSSASGDDMGDSEGIEEVRPDDAAAAAAAAVVPGPAPVAPAPAPHALEPLAVAVGLKAWDCAATSRTTCFVCRNVIPAGALRFDYRIKPGQRLGDRVRIHSFCLRELSMDNSGDISQLERWRAEPTIPEAALAELDGITDELRGDTGASGSSGPPQPKAVPKAKAKAKATPQNTVVASHSRK